jgi:hypothetical protein
MTMERGLPQYCGSLTFYPKLKRKELSRQLCALSGVRENPETEWAEAGIYR